MCILISSILETSASTKTVIAVIALPGVIVNFRHDPPNEASSPVLIVIVCLGLSSSRRTISNYVSAMSE